MEEWRPIPGTENKYEISNYGNVKSLSYHQTGKVKLLKPFPDKKGYLQVDINKKSRKVHRIVAEVYIPNPNKKPQINHKDGNKSNNRVDNLEWCTQSENQKHAYKHGLKPKSMERAHSNEVKEMLVNYSKKINDKRKIPVIAINIETGERTRYSSQSEAAKKLGVHQKSVGRICYGKQKQTKGYRFEFEQSSTAGSNE